MITLIRADERLIHGQTMQFVIPDYSIDRIIVVDDITASNDILKSIFKQAIPKNLTADICTIEESVEILKQTMNDNHKTLLLVKYPRTVLKLVDLLPEIPQELNIGSQMGKNGKKFTEYASLIDSDIEACKTLVKKGFRIYFNAIGSSGSVLEFKEK